MIESALKLNQSSIKVRKERKGRLKGIALSKRTFPSKAVKEKMKSQIILHVNTVEKGIILTSDVGRGLIYDATNAISLVILPKFARTKGSLKLKLK